MPIVRLHLMRLQACRLVGSYFACVAMFNTESLISTIMQTKIRNLGLDDKQRRLTEARNAYQAEKQRLSQLYGPAQELRSEAEAAQDVVNRKVTCALLHLSHRA